MKNVNYQPNGKFWGGNWTRSGPFRRIQVFQNLISDRFHADIMIRLFDSVLSQRPRNFESEQKLRQLGFVTPRHFELLCLKKHDMRI